MLRALIGCHRERTLSRQWCDWSVHIDKFNCYNSEVNSKTGIMICYVSLEKPPIILDIRNAIFHMQESATVPSTWRDQLLVGIYEYLSDIVFAICSGKDVWMNGNGKKSNPVKQKLRWVFIGIFISTCTIIFYILQLLKVGFKYFLLELEDILIEYVQTETVWFSSYWGNQTFVTNQ